MKNNTKTNNLIRNLVVIGDFLLLGLLFELYCVYGPGMAMAEGISHILLCMIAGIALMISE